MPRIKEVLTTLEQLVSLKQATTNKINELNPDNFIDTEMYQAVLKQLRKEESAWRERMVETLRQYDRFPERHAALFDRLEVFYENPGADLTARFDNSVFVMTKFPEPGDAEAEALQKVIDAVLQSIRDKGYIARIASEQDLHEWLWGNVAIYLLGCEYGVAIVEDKYHAELNPNVAMEWGWMRGMGRRVLFLRESSFNNDRADWSGLTSYSFDWAEPALGISEAIDKFLPVRDQ